MTISDPHTTYKAEGRGNPGFRMTCHDHRRVWEALGRYSISVSGDVPTVQMPPGTTHGRRTARASAGAQEFKRAVSDAVELMPPSGIKMIHVSGFR